MAETTRSIHPDGPADPTGDAIDWGTALVSHDRWLRTAVFARLGERQAVEEVMQDVALAAVAQRAPLRDGAKVAAWLYRLALRHVLIYRRLRGRQRKLLGRFAWSRGGMSSPEGALDPLGWLLRDERRAVVRRALETLGRRDAEILLLKYTEDWSYRKLAEHLGISEAAVEARLHRASKRLREAIAGSPAIEAHE